MTDHPKYPYPVIPIDPKTAASLMPRICFNTLPARIHAADEPGRAATEGMTYRHIRLAHADVREVLGDTVFELDFDPDRQLFAHWAEIEQKLMECALLGDDSVAYEMKYTPEVDYPGVRRAPPVVETYDLRPVKALLALSMPAGFMSTLYRGQKPPVHPRYLSAVTVVRTFGKAAWRRIPRKHRYRTARMQFASLEAVLVYIPASRFPPYESHDAGTNAG